MQGGERYNSINDYLKDHFGRKMVKLSIDAGFTCPNRDGSKGTGGCAFCSEGGSGELAAHEDSMADSISKQIDKISAKWSNAGYIAYFQSFTNTYAPVSYLRKVYYAALEDSRISGIAIATRPDCLSDDILDLLAEINENHFIWVELGLQSIHAKTQEAMNLCYTTEDYDRASGELAKRGIRFVTHLILGLPGESEEMMFESIDYVCRNSIRSRLSEVSDSGFDFGSNSVSAPARPFGLKLHLMNIVKTSPLYKAMPGYVPFDSIEEYVDLVVRCLEVIP